MVTTRSTLPSLSFLVALDEWSVIIASGYVSCLSDCSDVPIKVLNQRAGSCSVAHEAHEYLLVCSVEQ